MNSSKTDFTSCAKINLGLKIISQRPDGYHTIETLFQEISLADTIELEKVSNGWQFSCDNSDTPTDESNLCVQAYLELRARFPDLGGIRIHLKKCIPIGAGLGGGSSNAATVLKGMNKLYSLNLSNKRLEEIAHSIGADVPFFIRGETQLASGIGEVLSPVTTPPMGAILLVTLPIQIDTEWAYREVKNHLSDYSHKGKFAAAYEKVDFSLPFSWHKVEKLFENDFEPLVFQTYPEIGRIKDQLLENGAEFASLSGSGSTVFGIYKEERDAHKVMVLFPPPFQTFIAHPI